MSFLCCHFHAPPAHGSIHQRVVPMTLRVHLGHADRRLLMSTPMWTDEDSGDAGATHWSYLNPLLWRALSICRWPSLSRAILSHQTHLPHLSTCPQGRVRIPHLSSQSQCGCGGTYNTHQTVGHARVCVCVCVRACVCCEIMSVIVVAAYCIRASHAGG